MSLETNSELMEFNLMICKNIFNDNIFLKLILKIKSNNVMLFFCLLDE